ncbi:MAG: HAMP domain-containing histidine kinase [bacterium]|nr:HAMP domain-containing histidine kinase [bacterium]
MLLLSGVTLAVLLVFQIWRTWELESSARALELDRSEAVAARLLERSIRSPAVFEAAAGTRFVIRGTRPVVDPDLGWLEPIAAAADSDLLAQDRLDRAARAEFGSGDPAAARRAFDDLRQIGLPVPMRLRVLAAAAWQARRAGAAEREREFVGEFFELAEPLAPAMYGRETVATAVAAMLRLLGPDGRPDWLVQRVALLPAVTPLPTDVDVTERARVATRRAAIRAAFDVWQQVSPRQGAGVHGHDRAELLWWQPHPDGGFDVRSLEVAEFLAAVRTTAGKPPLPEWPWLVEPMVDDSPVPGFAAIPFVRGLQPASGWSRAEGRWLLPTLTLVLLAAFGLAVAQQLRAQRREAAAVRAQAEFLTTVTHELKTPLASIRLLGEMLVEGRARGRENDYYRMLASESGRLSMLIENVLDLGRLERGERAYDLRPCDVSEIVQETVTMLEPLAEREASRLVFEAPAQAMMACVDRAALVQALISVLDNARKYGRSPVEIGLTSEPGALVLTVRDHGGGVPVAERERIFERFTRGAAHAHGSTPGIGVGLYLARVIMRRLGGELACVAPGDGGAGACFVFRIPEEVAAATVAEAS